MNTLRKSLLIGLTALSMGSSALLAHAQQPATDQAAGAPMGHHMDGHHDMDPAKHAERMAKHQAALHDKLKLTAAQEPAWRDFTAAMAPKAGARQDRAELQAQMQSMTAPQRMEKMISMMKDHEADMTNKLQALKTFYAVLTPEQQKIFDANFGPGHGGRGHHGKKQGGQGAPAAQ